MGFSLSFDRCDCCFLQYARRLIFGVFSKKYTKHESLIIEGTLSVKDDDLL